MESIESIAPTRPEPRFGRSAEVIGKDVSSSGDQADHSGDAALFVRHLQGDHEALMELFDRYNERLWLYCARTLGDHQHANDVAQELWERVIRLRGKEIAPPAKPASYLFAAARNLCLNHFRSRRETAPIDSIAESDHPREHIPERSHLEELMEMALMQLPESQREVLVLNAYSGYGFDEIAEILNKPAGAIHTTAWRARKRLGEILSKLMKAEEGNTSTHDYLNNQQTERE